MAIRGTRNLWDKEGHKELFYRKVRSRLTGKRPKDYGDVAAYLETLTDLTTKNTGLRDSSLEWIKDHKDEFIHYMKVQDVIKDIQKTVNSGSNETLKEFLDEAIIGYKEAYGDVLTLDDPATLLENLGKLRELIKFSNNAEILKNNLLSRNNAKDVWLEALGKDDAKFKFPLILMNYASLADNDRIKTDQVIEALRDDDFRAAFPEAQMAGEKIADILENDTLSTDDKRTALNNLQSADSLKIQARLIRHLIRYREDNGYDFYSGFQAMRTPDMRFLIGPTKALNFNWSEDAKGGNLLLGSAGRLNPQFSGNPPSGSKTIIPSFSRDDKEEIVTVLQNRRAFLESIGTDSEILQYYDRVITAYSPDDAVGLPKKDIEWWNDVRGLNEEISSPDQLIAAYDIKEALKFTNHKIYNYRINATFTLGVPNMVTHTTNYQTLTSDQWMEGLDEAGDKAFRLSDILTEGMAVASLRETKGDGFADRFASAETLDDKEKILRELNAADLSKFNAALLEKAETIAEMLPPFFLTEMAKKIDEAMKEEGIEDPVKDSLKQQKDILLEAMIQTVDDYDDSKVEINSDNAAGVYDGAVEMAHYLEDNFETIKDDLGYSDSGIDRLKEEIDNLFLASDSILQRSVEDYDEVYDLSAVTPDDKKEVSKAYNSILKEADKYVWKNRKDGKYNDDFEKNFTEILDDETKEIFGKLKFPTDQDKKDFMAATIYAAAQQAATESFKKKKKERIAVFKELIGQKTIEETLRLVQAEDAVETALGGLARADDIDVTESLSEKKTKLTAKLASGINISTDAMAGYFADIVNRQSIWVNRLAVKINTRKAAVLQRMWEPFGRLDKTCIERFGKSYQVARGIFKQSLTNLPWSASNALTRVAAFSQIGTPWGMACVAGYAAYSLGTTFYRLERSRRAQKKLDPNNPDLKKGNFYLKNWDSILLSIAGTSVSVIPGLASGMTVLQTAAENSGWFADAATSVSDWMKNHLEWAKDAAKWMKDAGWLDQSNFMFKNPLHMTNLSLVMTTVGIGDSAIKGIIANRKLGNSWMKSIRDSLGISVLSSASGIATGVACGQVANGLWDKGFNLAADVRTITNDVKDDGFKEDSPNHNPDAEYSSETITKIDDLINNLPEEDRTEFNKLNTDLANVGNKAEEESAINKMTQFLEQHGMSVSEVRKDEGGILHIEWEEPGHSGYDDSIKIKGPDGVERSVAEHAAYTAADWQKDVPGLHESNIKAIESNAAISSFNEKNPTMAVDPNRMEMILMEAGARAVPADQDTHQIIDKSGHSHDVRGNHRVITDTWVDKYGANENLTKYCDGEPITKEDIAHLQTLHDKNGNFVSENVSERDLKVLNALDHFISAKFEVGDVPEARSESIGPKYIPSITNVNQETGELQSAKGADADRMNTYANGIGCRKDVDPVPHEKHYEVDKYARTDHAYMPINPSVDLYTFVRKKMSYLSKIMGNHGKKKAIDGLAPVKTGGRL